jgi:hypothetical protein
MERGIQLARDHHRADVLVRRDLPHHDTRRRLEAGGAAMAVLGSALHPEFHLRRSHAELVLQRAARPQGGGLLIFRHAHALALEVARARDPGGAPHQHLRVEEASGGEHRQSDPGPVAPCRGDQQRGDRHLRHVEIGKAQLAPEHLRRVQRCRHKVDAVRLRCAGQDRPRPRVLADGEAQGQVHRGLPTADPAARAGPRARFRGRSSTSRRRARRS